ncbi:MAG: glycosyltransferase family 9 protein [Bacteroidetes bacterium]|nr:glycosyltransferase family 9 protein [Bacteroidota bacterium]
MIKHVLKRIECWWRHRIVYPLFRNILSNVPYEGSIDLRFVKKILFLRHDRIGDMIVTTPFFQILKARYPHLTIGVTASPRNIEIIQHNEYVDAIYLIGNNVLQTIHEIHRMKCERYDVIVNLIFNRTTSLGLLAYYVSKDGVKIGQGNEKYRFYFNKYFSYPRNTKHMVQLIATILSQSFAMTICDSELEYSIHIPMSVKQFVHQYIESKAIPKLSNGRFNFILLNLSPSVGRCGVTRQQIQNIVEHLTNRHENVVIIYDPQDATMRTLALELLRYHNCFLFPEERKASLLELAAIIHNAYCVVTPDTSVVHFASAMKTPVCALYTPLSEYCEWQPWKVPHISILADEHQPVSSIPSSTIIEQLDKFILQLRSANEYSINSNVHSKS